MGLDPAAIKLNLELWKNAYFKDTHSVLELGSQGLHLNLADFEELLGGAGISDYKKEKFMALAQWPNGPGCSSRAFYEALGLNEYACIDLNKKDGAIPLDLNYPLEDKSLFGKYDLVTDHGTNEHVFNTPQAFHTMHKLCKPTGIMLISQAVFRGKGYYAYDPSFLEGMAAANNYRILYSSFVINQFHVPLSWELMDTFDFTKMKGLRVFYAMQKQSEADFRTPYQGRFLSQNQKHLGFEVKYLQNPLSRAYAPLDTFKGIDDDALFGEFRKRLNKKIKKCLHLS